MAAHCLRCRCWGGVTSYIPDCKQVVPMALLPTAMWPPHSHCLQAEHDGKPFFPKLVDFLTSGAVVVSWYIRSGVTNQRAFDGLRGAFQQVPQQVSPQAVPRWCCSLPAFGACWPPDVPGPPAMVQAMVFEGKDVVKTGALLL